MTRRLSHGSEFDLVVIGGGTAGLVTAAGAAALGARVALVERARMGGECLWTGCVPSKALIASGRVAALGRRGADFGLPSAATLLGGTPASAAGPDASARRERGIDGGPIDGAAVMHSMREVRERIAPHDSPERFRGLGVEVVEAEARFLSPRKLEAGGRILTSRRFLIATGSRPDVPTVDGLEETGYFTNEDAFERRDLPRSVLILGAGPNGCEMAQAYRRLDVEVALVEVAGRILEREEPELTGRLRRILESEGVRVLTGWRAVRAERRGDRRALVLERADGDPESGIADPPTAEPRTARPRAAERRTTEPLGAALRIAERGTADGRIVEGDEILVATGRCPNVEGLGLEAAGVEVGPSGIVVDSRLRTSARHIYAAGDVTGSLRFTHVADHEARTVLANALAPVAVARIDYSVIPWATFTDPSLARVGWTEAEARERHGENVRAYAYDLAGLDRAITDREAEGCVKLVADRRGRLLGGHILASGAGTMIVEVALAMRHGIRVKDLSKLVHPYPTMSEGVRRAANEAYRSALSDRGRRWLDRYFRLMRRLGA